jgi:hypothetical protein
LSSKHRKQPRLVATRLLTGHDPRALVPPSTLSLWRNLRRFGTPERWATTQPSRSGSEIRPTAEQLTSRPKVPGCFRTRRTRAQNRLTVRASASVSRQRGPSSNGQALAVIAGGVLQPRSWPAFSLRRSRLPSRRVARTSKPFGQPSAFFCLQAIFRFAALLTRRMPNQQRHAFIHRRRLTGLDEPASVAGGGRRPRSAGAGSKVNAPRRRKQLQRNERLAA